MGAWRGSVFTSGHVLSLELGKPLVYVVKEHKVKQVAILYSRSFKN